MTTAQPAGSTDSSSSSSSSSSGGGGDSARPQPAAPLYHRLGQICPCAFAGKKSWDPFGSIARRGDLAASSRWPPRAAPANRAPSRDTASHHPNARPFRHVPSRAAEVEPPSVFSKPSTLAAPPTPLSRPGSIPVRRLLAASTARGYLWRRPSVFSAAAAAIAGAIGGLYGKPPSSPVPPVFRNRAQSAGLARAAAPGGFTSGGRRTLHTASESPAESNSGLGEGVGRNDPALPWWESTGAARSGSAAELGTPCAPRDAFCAETHQPAAGGSFDFNTTLGLTHGQALPRTKRHYAFSHGAAGLPKRRSSNVIPTEEERAYRSHGAGEDAYFTRHDSLGVADGVGGWCEVEGANPAIYSRKLMHYALKELEKFDNFDYDEFYEYFDANPTGILRKSFDLTSKDAAVEGLVGSSTACIAILREDELRIANLGDCGVAVIRHGNIVFRTEEQQHTFNFPHQLGTGSRDTPEDAQVFAVKVQTGDIVVMGTDGIFDNLFDEDILEEVLHMSSVPLSAWKMAGLAAEAAGHGAFQRAAPKYPASTIPVTPECLPQIQKLHIGGDAMPQAPERAQPANHQVANLARSAVVPAIATINPQQVSAALARRAKAVAEDTSNVSSPFQAKAMQEGMYFQGGKADDITVIVCQIIDCDDSPIRS